MLNLMQLLRLQRSSLNDISPEPETMMLSAEPTNTNSIPPFTQTPSIGVPVVSLPYLSDLEQLKTIDRLSGSPKNPILIGGDLVQYALQDTDNDDPNFIRQPDRPAGSGLSSAKLRIWVHRDVVTLATGKPRRHLALAVDSLIQYGCRESRTSAAPLILVHGAPVRDRTLLHLFTFTHGSLTNIDEYTAQAQTGYRFAPEIESLLQRHLQADAINRTDDLQYTGTVGNVSNLMGNTVPGNDFTTRIVWTAPLHPIELPHLENSGQKPFERPIQRTIRWQSSTLVRAIRLPATLCVLCTLAYAGVAIWHLNAFDEARQRQLNYAKNVEALAVNLDTLRARRDWLAPRTDFEREIERLHATLAVLDKHQDWAVLSLRIPGNQPNSSAQPTPTSGTPSQPVPDSKAYELIVRLARNNQSPLEQARPVLTEISNATHSNLYLPAGNTGQVGWKEIDVEGRKWLELTILGNRATVQPLPNPPTSTK